MNLLVFSDSHGRGSNMLEALSRQIKKPDAIIFLGDGLRDLTYCEFGDIPLFAVSGNCDGAGIYGGGIAENQIVMSLGGKKIMMTHGDLYGVKNGLARIASAADYKGVDIVLFGHTHEPFATYLPEGDESFGFKIQKPMYLFNPGSIGGYERSFGCITIDSRGGVLMSHGNLER